MPRPNRTLRSKVRSSTTTAARFKLPTQKKRESEEESTVLQTRDDNVDDNASSLSPSLGDKRRRKTESRNSIGRPPLPRKKVTKSKSSKKKEAKDEAQENEEVSPLRKLLGRHNLPAVATGVQSPVRPRRRAAVAGKKKYIDVHSDTDDESSSSDESKDDHAYRTKNEKKIKAKAKPCGRKVNKRKIDTPRTRKTNAKKLKVKTPSPFHSSKRRASSASKEVKNSPSILSTPKGAIIGLTPIKDSVSKVWENRDGDWRVQGAIDYDF